MSNDKKVTFTDYLYVIYKWRKFLLINLAIIIIISISYSFLITKTYKATTTIMIPSGNSVGLGDLLGGGNSAMSLGAKILGVASTNEDLVMGLLRTRNVLNKVINKFDLFTYYEIDEQNFDKLYKLFVNDIVIEPNEYGLIEISIINKDPVIASKMANYFVELGDSLNIEISGTQARNYRIFIEERYLANTKDVFQAEESLKKFQLENGVFNVPEQLKAGIEMVATLETELLQKEIMVDYLEKTMDPNQPTFKNAVAQFVAAKSKLQKIYSEKGENSLLIPLNNAPNLEIDFIRLYREMEIQNKIMEFIYPLYEQAKMDERKNLPTLVTIDKAVPPDLKHYPKRAFIVIGFTSFVFFLSVIIIFRGEKSMNNISPKNLIEEKEQNYFRKILKIYRFSIS